MVVVVAVVVVAVVVAGIGVGFNTRLVAVLAAEVRGAVAVAALEPLAFRGVADLKSDWLPLRMTSRDTTAFCDASVCFFTSKLILGRDGSDITPGRCDDAVLVALVGAGAAAEVDNLVDGCRPLSLLWIAGDAECKRS